MATASPDYPMLCPVCNTGTPGDCDCLPADETDAEKRMNKSEQKPCGCRQGECETKSDHACRMTAEIREQQAGQAPAGKTADLAFDLEMSAALMVEASKLIDSLDPQTRQGLALFRWPLIDELEGAAGILRDRLSAHQAELEPLTLDEVRLLTCMHSGAPWHDQMVQVVRELLVIYEDLRAQNKRPFDPADLEGEEHGAYFRRLEQLLSRPAT